MRYTIGDIFQWNYKPESNNISTLISIKTDNTGQEKYTLESYISGSSICYIKETYSEEELVMTTFSTSVPSFMYTRGLSYKFTTYAC